MLSKLFFAPTLGRKTKIVCGLWGREGQAEKNLLKMSGGEHEQWLYRGDKGRDVFFRDSMESAVIGSPGMGGPKEDLPKDYEAIRSWVEYSKSKNWLMEASRVSDQSTTLSTPPREHQVAVPLPKGEVEKWLVRPTADTLAEQLQAKLFISSENPPWLMSRTPKDDENAITGHFSAVLSSPNSQWLCKRSSRPAELAKWLLEPKKPRLDPTSSFDPLSTWKTFEEGIDWLASPFCQEHNTDLEVDAVSGEDDDLLHFPPVATTSLPLPFNNHQQVGVDIDKWLLPSSAPSCSSLPLFESTKPVVVASTLDQWLPQSHSPSEPESEASLLTLSSEYELVNEL